MLAFKKSLEDEVMAEIAALERELAMMMPMPEKTPVVTLEQNNVISLAFNSVADKDAINAYIAALPRREGLNRRLAFLKRRLAALRLHSAHAGSFMLAA